MEFYRIPIIFLVCFSIIIGVFLGLYFDLEVRILLFIISPIYLFFIVSLFLKKDYILIFFLLLVSISLGFLRTEIQNDTEEDLKEETVRTGGIVLSEKEDKNKYTRYVIENVSIGDDKIESNVFVYEPFPSNCEINDKFSASGRLSLPEDFYTNTGRVFPYREFLLKDNIKYMFFVTEDTRDPCEEIDDFSFNKLISIVRQFFLGIMQKILPEPESSLLAGLLLGVRGFLSDSLLEMFRITGLIHIIVLSGYNVTLVAEAIRRIFSFMPRNSGIWLSMFSIILFVLLAGAGTVAVRAGIMASIALLAKLLRRESDGIRALIFAGTIMILINPLILFFDVSFHLSFLATFGLLLYGSIFEKRLQFITDRFQIRGIVAATLSTQLFILPYLAYQIGEVSLIGVLANIIVLPLVPIAMAVGMIGAVLGIFLPSALVTIFAYLPLKTIIFFTEFFASFPYSSVELPYVPLIVMLVGYILLFIPILISKIP